MDNLIELYPKKNNTICVECKFCTKDDPNLNWYEYFCEASEVRRKEVMDPVTGKTRYFISLDNPLSDDAAPYCRDINTNGKCRFFKQRKT